MFIWTCSFGRQLTMMCLSAISLNLDLSAFKQVDWQQKSNHFVQCSRQLFKCISARWEKLVCAQTSNWADNASDKDQSLCCCSQEIYYAINHIFQNKQALCQKQPQQVCNRTVSRDGWCRMTAIRAGKHKPSTAASTTATNEETWRYSWSECVWTEMKSVTLFTLCDNWSNQIDSSLFFWTSVPSGLKQWHKEPFICLDNIPGVLSVTTDTPIPPTPHTHTLTLRLPRGSKEEELLSIDSWVIGDTEEDQCGGLFLILGDIFFKLKVALGLLHWGKKVM